MAENTTEEQSTEQIAQVITQIDNPFEQTEEVVSRDFVSQSFLDEAPTEDLPTEEQQAAINQPAADAPKVESEEDGDPVEWLNEQWREKGVKIGSLDEIPQIINAYNKLLSEKPTAYSAEEQARIKLGRETGNWQLYDQIVSIDTTKIEAREAMRTKFVLERPTMSTVLANQMFEKELKRVLSEDDSEEFIQQYLEYEGAIAKKWLDDKKASINIAEDSNVEEKVQQSDGEWFKSVDSVIDQIVLDKNLITYELEDGKAVNVVIDHEQLQELRDAMDSPQGWIRDNILNEHGSFDHMKLMQLIIKNMHSDIISKEFYELGRTHEQQHLLSKQRGTLTPQIATGAPRNNTDMRDNVAGVLQSFSNRR